jgi:hypothetical protein
MLISGYGEGERPREAYPALRVKLVYSAASVYSC